MKLANNKINKKLKMPVIIVWGDKDKVTPLEEAKRIHEKVKNSTLHAFKGGHLVLEKNPKEVIYGIVKQLRLRGIIPKPTP